MTYLRAHLIFRGQDVILEGHLTCYMHPLGLQHCLSPVWQLQCRWLALPPPSLAPPMPQCPCCALPALGRQNSCVHISQGSCSILSGGVGMPICLSALGRRAGDPLKGASMSGPAALRGRLAAPADPLKGVCRLDVLVTP